MLDKIIVFAGRFGSGKSTLANMLHDELVDKDLPCYKISFAAILKQMLGGLLKADFISNDELKNESVTFKDKLISCRSLLQNLGDIVRFVDKDYFVKQVCYSLGHYKKGVAIIDDLRFPNELAPLISFAKRLYIVTIESHYDDNDNSAELKHASENYEGLKGFIKRFIAKHNSVAWLGLESRVNRDTQLDREVLLDFVGL